MICFIILMDSTNGYKKIKQIGKGSYGVVYSGIDKLGNPVAIKEYKLRNADIDARTEIAMLQSLKDTCSYYSSCFHEMYIDKSSNTINIVIDLVEGIGLGEYMDKFRIGQRSRRFDILYNLTMGLNKIHKSGVAHQDIKFQNIMWDHKNHRARFIDWGLGCLVDKYCKSDKPCDRPCDTSGTAYTSPPELKKFGSGNEKTGNMVYAHDIWSLGVILYLWYTLDFYKNINIKLYGGSEMGGLSELAPKYWDENTMCENIKKVTERDPLAAEIIGLMLTPNWKTRLENWPKIIELLTAPTNKYKIIKRAINLGNWQLLKIMLTDGNPLEKYMVRDIFVYSIVNARFLLPVVAKWCIITGRSESR